MPRCLCITVGAGAAGALNMWYDADIDARMARTAGRPIPRGRVTPGEAAGFGFTLAVFSVVTLGLLVNVLAAALLAFTIFFYVAIYTVWLKRSTPQNIVIGGAAGALPPMIGWAAASGTLALEPVLLFLIIFFWTPPHFWALSLYRVEDYARAGIPMLPVVAGEQETRRQILLYTLILAPLGVAPWLLGYAGSTYGVAALTLGGLYDRAGAAGAERAKRACGQQAAVRLLDPLFVSAVCHAAGRPDVGRAVRPFRGMTIVSELMNDVDKPGTRRGDRHQAHGAAVPRAPLTFDRDRAGARRLCGADFPGDDRPARLRRADPADVVQLRRMQPRPKHKRHEPQRARSRDFLVAFLCGGFVAVMVGVSFAAVPLYSWFCRTTGFGGTTQVAKSLPTQQSARTITVRFDSNVADGLPWRFEPERNTIDVRLGQVVTVYYKVTNEAARVTVGQAGYNVSPPTVGIYFEKINCFCFTQQTMTARRNARHGGGVLCRSQARQGFRAGRHQHDHALLHLLSGA